MSANSVLPPTGFTTLADRSEYFAGIGRNELSECQSMFPRLNSRTRDSRDSGWPSRPRFDTSFMPTWRRLSSGFVMLPPRASSRLPKFWLNAICCSSVIFWSWKTSTAQRSIPASIALTSSGESGLAMSIPDTSPTNTGWICRTEMAMDGSLSQPAHAPNRYRSRQTLQRDRPEIVRFAHALHGARDPGRDEELGGGGFAAEPCGAVRNGPDRAVVQTALEANGPDGGIALGDAHAERQIPAALAPARGQVANDGAHGDSHANRALGRVRNLHRVVEEDHHAVAGEALERALVREDQTPHLGVVLAQYAHDLLGLGRLREGGEAAQVEEHHSHLAPMGLQGIVGAAGHDELGELRREKALETAQLLELGDLLGDTTLERLIPLGQLLPVANLLIVQTLLLEARADPGL